MSSHFAPLFVDRGVELATAGSLISLMALASVFTNVLLGTVNDRRGTLSAVLLSLACQVLALGGYLLSEGMAPLAGSTVVFAFAVAFPGVLIPILVMLLFGVRDYPAILGPAMALMTAGVAAGTPLWGAAYDATGSYDLALVVSVAATVVLGALLTWAVRSAPGLRSRVERDLSGGDPEGGRQSR